MGKPTDKSKKPAERSGKKTAKKSKNRFLNFDLLYQLSYMAVISQAGVPRDRMFERAATLKTGPADYFKRLELARTRLGYDYATACRVVGDAAEEEEMKGLLLRLSSSLLSGEPEATFLSREAEAMGHAYDNDYDKKIDILRKWTDSYISLILAGVLVVIVGIISTMIWPIELVFILGLVTVSVGTTALGVWLIYLMVPMERVVLSKPSSTEQKLARKMLMYLVPLAAVACALVVLGGVPNGWIMLTAGVLILPIGLVSHWDDQKVTRRDSEMGGFLGSLGGVCSAVGTTVKDALGRMDLDAINFLRPQVKRLHTRLLSGIAPRRSWEYFIAETGSELANRSVSMFYDAIELGGDPAKAGYQASLFANKITLLRAQRKSISSSFGWLSLAMHGAIIGLLIFIAEVIGIFGEMVATAQESMPAVTDGPAMGAFTTFNMAGLDIMTSLVFPLVVAFTVGNAMAPSIVDGGSRLKAMRNMGFTLGLSGFCLVAFPFIAKSLFASITI
ncbi:MAG: hypothetical protein V3S82_00505 [Dehalococcoidia bacterium]